jgi:hypothetical protein
MSLKLKFTKNRLAKDVKRDESRCRKLGLTKISVEISDSFVSDIEPYVKKLAIRSIEA